MSPLGEPAPVTESARERWQRVDRILTEAAQLDPACRPAWLEGACADDDVLRREVEALLDAHGKVGDSLENVVAAEVRRLAELAPGARIGAYEVVAPLGEGGMGMGELLDRGAGRLTSRSWDEPATRARLLSTVD